jgi:hypothetical protein
LGALSPGGTYMSSSSGRPNVGFPQITESQMVTTTTDTAPATKAASPDDTGKTASRSQRTRTESGEETNEHSRYFLGKPDNSGDTPALDREVSSEGEALVEALRSGVTFYTLQEFRVVPDFSGRRPQLKKEPVQAK